MLISLNGLVYSSYFSPVFFFFCRTIQEKHIIESLQASIVWVTRSCNAFSLSMWFLLFLLLLNCWKWYNFMWKNWCHLGACSSDGSVIWFYCCLISSFFFVCSTLFADNCEVAQPIHSALELVGKLFLGIPRSGNASYMVLCPLVGMEWDFLFLVVVWPCLKLYNFLSYILLFWLLWENYYCDRPPIEWIKEMLC